LSKSSSGREIGVALFNGKIDSPRIAKRALTRTEMEQAIRSRPPGDAAPDVVAAWDFSLGIPSQQILDVAPNRLHGRLINLPTRAMKGAAWTGAERDWTRAPHHYAAIHFHDDDLHDCGWADDFDFTIPKDMRSGVYGMQLSCGVHRDIIPFFVRPQVGKPQAKVCCCRRRGCMAYASEHAAFDGSGQVLSVILALTSRGSLPQRASEYGYSLYDTHSDGTWLVISSSSPNPQHAPWLHQPVDRHWRFSAMAVECRPPHCGLAGSHRAEIRRRHRRGPTC
jgi:N,N-dimethylformamidase